MVFIDLYRNIIVACRGRKQQCILLNNLQEQNCKYINLCLLLRKEPSDIKIEDLQKVLHETLGEIVYTKIDGAVIHG